MQRLYELIRNYQLGVAVLWVVLSFLFPFLIRQVIFLGIGHYGAPVSQSTHHLTSRLERAAPLRHPQTKPGPCRHDTLRQTAQAAKTWTADIRFLMLRCRYQGLLSGKGFADASYYQILAVFCLCVDV